MNFMNSCTRQIKDKRWEVLNLITMTLIYEPFMVKTGTKTGPVEINVEINDVFLVCYQYYNEAIKLQKVTSCKH